MPYAYLLPDEQLHEALLRAPKLHQAVQLHQGPTHHVPPPPRFNNNPLAKTKQPAMLQLDLDHPRSPDRSKKLQRVCGCKSAPASNPPASFAPGNVSMPTGSSAIRGLRIQRSSSQRCPRMAFHGQGGGASDAVGAIWNSEKILIKTISYLGLH